MTAPVPRALHQIWVGGAVPDVLAGYADGWRRLHPGWGYRLWGDDDLGWLENREVFDQARRIVPGHAVGQFRADVARYELLWHYGGVYVDLDFEPRLPIDDLLDGGPFAVEEAPGYLANGLIGVPPGHPAMRRAIDRLPRSCRTRAGQSAARVSGPAFFTALLQPDEFRALPREWFLPYSWADVDRGEPDYDPEGCYAVHHWRHRRALRGRDLC